jgi:hypothetical protein
MTVSIKAARREEEIRENVSLVIQYLQLQNPLPVYSKCMYMLQCSECCAVYEEHYKEELSYVENICYEKLQENNFELEKLADAQSCMMALDQLNYFDYHFALSIDRNQIWKSMKENSVVLEDKIKKGERPFSFSSKDYLDF